jgi:hypothetical protein
MRLKKPSLKLAKQKAWKAFSEYIRRKNSDYKGNCICVTCGTYSPWKSMQASHFIDGRGNSILFEERGVHPACYVCNVCKHGNKVEYFRFMQRTYGDAIIDELRMIAKYTLKRTAEDYKVIEETYKQKIKELGEK